MQIIMGEKKKEKNEGNGFLILLLWKKQGTHFFNDSYPEHRVLVAQNSKWENNLSISFLEIDKALTFARNLGEGHIAVSIDGSRVYDEYFFFFDKEEGMYKSYFHLTSAFEEAKWAEIQRNDGVIATLRKPLSNQELIEAGLDSGEYEGD